MKTRFFANEKGKVISAVVPIKEYEAVLEDLAAVVERRNEVMTIFIIKAGQRKNISR